MDKDNKPGTTSRAKQEVKEEKGKKKKGKREGNVETVYARPADVFRDKILEE